MDTVIFEGWGWILTPWKIVGYMGVFLFAGRWFVQLYDRKCPAFNLFHFWEERFGWDSFQSDASLYCQL
jgi:lipid-A-disaccharide synthase-like uncharacterized protein